MHSLKVSSKIYSFIFLKANILQRCLFDRKSNMVLTDFNGAGIGFGFGVGCGFGVGWGFGGMPLNFMGLGAGGGCGIGLGLGWGFGTAFGSKYRSSRVIFQGLEFGIKDQSDDVSFKDLSQSTQEVRASQ